jgi:hypothetical protein
LVSARADFLRREADAKGPLNREWVDVTAIVDWVCSSPARQATSVGSEQFTFRLHVEGPGVFTILSEDAQVLTRTVSGGVRAINASGHLNRRKQNSGYVEPQFAPCDANPHSCE